MIIEKPSSQILFDFDPDVSLPQYPYRQYLELPDSPISQYYSQGRRSPALSSYGSTAPLLGKFVPSLTGLPIHILLQIIHNTFPYNEPRLPAYEGFKDNALSGYPSRDTADEIQRRMLLWVSTSLRLVNRTLYIACMHVLRTAYLHAYRALVRSPYTSDPFPTGTAAVRRGPPGVDPSLAGPQRETMILDRFLLLKIRQDILADESELHLDHEDSFRDLFEVAQPRARLEDLVRDLGTLRGVVVPDVGNSIGQAYLAGGGARNSSSTSLLLREVDAQIEAREVGIGNQAGSSKAQTKKKGFFSFKKSSSSDSTQISPTSIRFLKPLPFSALTISFQPRRVAVIVARTRTLVEVARTPGRRQTLETLASLLVSEIAQIVGVQ